MNNCDEDRSIFTGHTETEVIIDRPVSMVWKQFLDVPSWVTSHHIEYALGEPGSLGSITRVSPNNAEEAGGTPNYHYCKIIKLEPEKRYILKTYSEKGGSYGGINIASFDDMRFFEFNGKTKLTFDLFAEMSGESVDSDSINLDISKEGMLKNLNNLKRIVEGG